MATIERMSDAPEPCRGRRRGSAWTKVSHGLYRPASQLAGRRGDLEAWALVLPPSGVFTHLTAAAVYGWWLPPLPADLPVFASMSADECRPRRAGLRVTRHPGPPERVVAHGLPLATPAETLLGCARDLGLLDLVVLLDGALHRRACTGDDVTGAAGRRRTGAPMLRAALRHADPRSESAWETVLRILHVVCEVPVEPQLEVFDEHGGFLARGDLWIKGTRTLHEYDGGEHLEQRRHRQDLVRERRLGRAQWTRRGYTSHEVLEQAVGILRDADLSLGRPHRPERVRAWHALLAGSLFTPSGTHRLRRRWGLPVGPDFPGTGAPGAGA